MNLYHRKLAYLTRFAQQRSAHLGSWARAQVVGAVSLWLAVGRMTTYQAMRRIERDVQSWSRQNGSAGS